MSDLRRYFRYEVNLPGKVQDSFGKQVQGKTINISLHGLLFELPVEFTAGEQLLVSFSLDHKRPITTWCEVIWSYETNLGSHYHGLDFQKLDSRHYTQVAEFISKRFIQSHPA